ETNAGLTTNGTLTVTDADLSDTVTPTVPLATLSGVTGGLTRPVLVGKLQVSPASIAANPGDTHNLKWSFNSATQAFTFLAANETLTLTYTVKVDDGHPGGTATQAVTIIICFSVNAPPTTFALFPYTTLFRSETNAGLTTNGTLTVTDADLSDTV